MTRHTLLTTAVLLVPACTLFAPGDEDFLGRGASGAHQGGRAAAGWSGSGNTPPESGAGGEAGELGALGGAGGFLSSSGAAGEAGSNAADAGGRDNEGAAGADGGVDAGGAPTSGAGRSGGAGRGGSSAGASSGGSGAGGAAGGNTAGGSGGMSNPIGCSDGTREAFVSSAAFPGIAGCKANWPRGSMRIAPTGSACGNAIGQCAVPADACAVGWHVCAAPPHGPGEVSAQITAQQCLAASGAYAMAVGDQRCEACSITGDGVACCGDGCLQQNGSCVFPEQTAWFGIIDGHMNRCGDVEANYLAQGVLCCRTP